jgi:antitoxin (DNA-binding transcriptional repressor) of toxin-antitoxin stability system
MRLSLMMAAAASRHARFAAEALKTVTGDLSTDGGAPWRTRPAHVKLHHQVQQSHGLPIMEKVSLLEFRRHAVAVIRKVRQGRRLIMTYRGAPVMRLEPIETGAPGADDPFYKISQLAAADGRPLTNEEIDQAVYEVRDVR